MEEKELVCIVCPRGCRLTITKESNDYIVEGNKCNRGRIYGIKEITNPTRVVTSTVKFKNGLLPRLPVKTNGPIPKRLIKQCVEEIKRIEVDYHVKVGDIIIKDILHTGIDVVSTKTM
ncbi:DUF1667 domain-containing protein [Tissierella sp. MSJ-40]|uniref:DUF1667 domain-containing protein n=1 Tax=Tissierella simiarum TaxID=2841534 RepID=A0ABS6EAR2_9FIRM|nr:DUF1667 domain-containing protein [Tissierella simiarum]MBU5439268.1 DUF1667 domain-containing protein [Tissierella simiarum]